MCWRRGGSGSVKRLFVSYDPVRVGQLFNLLEDSGISCLLRNHYLGGAAGELPVNECWPELWVIAPGDYQRASALIAEMQAGTGHDGQAWSCEACGESLEPQFSDCWNCGCSGPRR